MPWAQVFSGGNGTCKSLTCEVWRHVSPTNDLGSSGIAGRPPLKVFRKRKKRPSLQSLPCTQKKSKCWESPSFSYWSGKEKTTIDLRTDVHGFFLRVAFLLPKRGFHGWPQVMSTEKCIPHQKMTTYMSWIQTQVVNFAFLFPGDCTLENLEDVDVCSWLRFFSSETHQSTVGFWMLEVQS